MLDVIYTLMAEDEDNAFVALSDTRAAIDRWLRDYGRDPTEVRRERWGLEREDIAEQESLLSAIGGVLG